MNEEPQIVKHIGLVINQKLSGCFKTILKVPLMHNPPIETVYYLKNGKQHREGGPAFFNNRGKKEWFINGIRHREDGPALISKYTEVFYWYGCRAKNVEQWIDSNWRKRAEIKRFL